MGKRPSGAADRMDSPRACADASRFAVHQAWKVFCLSGFCALTAACVVDSGPIDHRLCLAEETLHARHEPVAGTDRSLRYHALAVCVYRPRDKAILFCVAGWLFRTCNREDPQLAATLAVFDNVRLCDLCKIDWNCFGAGDCLPGLRTVSR